MRDFTLKIYRRLLSTAIDSGFSLTSLQQFMQSPKRGKIFILRHDVDKWPENSLKTARIQYSLGARGTYYFRVVKDSFNEKIIREIAGLGHEIGYHYEDLAIMNGDIEKAFVHFKEKLDLFRKFYPVKTIAMHGSPLSRWDNRDLWKKFDYKKLGLIAEPYFDIDFSNMLYLSDTGRGWNNKNANFRDRVNSSIDRRYSSTFEIISDLKENRLPSLLMHNIHPQRWNDDYVKWTYEFAAQNLKNQIKYVFLLSRLKRNG